MEIIYQTDRILFIRPKHSLPRSIHREHERWKNKHISSKRAGRND